MADLSRIATRHASIIGGVAFALVLAVLTTMVAERPPAPAPAVTAPVFEPFVVGDVIDNARRWDNTPLCGGANPRQAAEALARFEQQRIDREWMLTREQAALKALLRLIPVDDEPPPVEPVPSGVRWVAAQGAIDRATLRRALQHHVNGFAQCYSRYSMKEATLAGTRPESVTVQLVLDATGAIRASSAAGLSHPVSACVLEIVREIRFPRSDGATQMAAALALSVR